MKSMCHDARRNSPSVADCRPDVLLHARRRRGSRSSSTARSSSASMRPAAWSLARLRAARAGAAGCRRGRRGTAGWCAGPWKLRQVSKRKADVVLGEARRRGPRGAHVAQLGELEPRSNGRRPAEVQHRRHPQEKCCAPPDAAQARRRSTRRGRTRRRRRTSASSAPASTRTSATARFRPFAPVGGTMCAASPARNSRPCASARATKLRIGVTPFSRIGPSASGRPSRGRGAARARPRCGRRASPASRSSGGTCR